jgi:hypothetical protein
MPAASDTWFNLPWSVGLRKRLQGLAIERESDGSIWRKVEDESRSLTENGTPFCPSGPVRNLSGSASSTCRTNVIGALDGSTGTMSQTWRDARHESVMRSKADMGESNTSAYFETGWR